MVNAGLGYDSPPDDFVSDERRHGFMSKRAARDGRVRSHSIGHSGGGHRLFCSSASRERKTTTCPRCRTPMPALRKPTSIAEGMGGGWTAQGAFRSWLGRIAETIAKVSDAISSHRLRTVLSAPVKASLSNVPRTTTNQPPSAFRASRMNCLTDRRMPAGRWACSNSLRTMILAIGMPLMRHGKGESCRAGQRQAYRLVKRRLPLAE
jgi:hypothetical protein